LSDFENRLGAQKALKLAADRQAAADAAAEAERLQHLAHAARERATPLVPEVYEAIGELRRLHNESYHKLLYARDSFPAIRMYAETRTWPKGFKRLEWTIGRLTVPLRGHPWVLAPKHNFEISIEEFAEDGYYEWYSHSEEHAGKDETLSADHELGRALDVLAAHIASL
jgi:hypothetical protein